MTRLELLRREKNLTQAKLAKLSGISMALISAYERGTRIPTMRSLIPIAEALGVEAKDLFLSNEEQQQYMEDIDNARHGDTPLKRAVLKLMERFPEQVMVLYECPCESAVKHNHHFDYRRPFDVFKLCPKCHRAEHARIGV